MLSSLSIVIVEDHVMLRDEMRDFLCSYGWQVQGVDCGEELNEWLRDNTPDIVILDVNLPYEDGCSIAARLRQSHPDVGIIMMTARVRSADRAEGYRSGADVYLTKPMHTNELLAVVESLASRRMRKAERMFRLEKTSQFLVAPNGQACALNPVEFFLIEALALSPRKTAHKDYLLEQINDRLCRQITPESLAVYLSRLRAKCRQHLIVDSLIMADRGVGYRLTVPVEFAS